MVRRQRALGSIVVVVAFVAAAVGGATASGAMTRTRRPLVMHATAIPNDPSFGQLWGMTKIAAPAAWDHGTGDGSAVVAVVDTGVDATHPDLAPNMWHNPGGIWGCAAGTTGYDVVNSDCDPSDDYFHGTHVAGTIGAAGNNSIGVAGVSWQVQLMAIKVLDETGSGTDVGVATGIEKAVAAKNAGVNVRAINMSLGGDGTSDPLQAAIADATAAGIVVVAAAGNDAVNVDTNPVSPCIYATLCVAATSSSDHRASFSNYGTTNVDIAAPGVGILSTTPGGNYGSLQGTSMATPHVTGAIALLAQTAQCRTMTASQLASLVLASADTVSGLTIASNRRLNVARAMNTCDPTPSPLTNGVYVRHLASSAGTNVTYKLTVPAARTKVVFILSGGIGNADLYVRRGAPPTLATYDCRSIKKANADSCTFVKPAAGDYDVMIHATAAYTNLSVHGTYTPK